jgi:hypothetical protein
LNAGPLLLGGAGLGADAFIVFYGLRYTLSEGELETVEQRTDHRVTAARRVKLQTYFGRLTGGEPHFLLVGTRLCVLGAENESAGSVDGVELRQIMSDTAAKLQEAGLSGRPGLHLEFEAEY